MKFEFTPAAQRALLAATRWHFSPSAYNTDLAEGLTPPALLLGLLDEPECRAALWLSACSIDKQAVLTRWPGLTCQASPLPARPAQLSTELELALNAAAALLPDCSPPLVLATEHLLLSLAASTHETGAWLREQGMDPAQLASQIQAIYGLSSEPLIDPELAAADTHTPVRPQRNIVPEGAPRAAGQPSTTPTTAANSAADSPNIPCNASMPPLAPETNQNTPTFDTSQSGASKVVPHKIDTHPREAECHTSIARVLDAAANRAREAMRVIEDYTRFVLDDLHLTAQLKAMRHELVERLASVPEAVRLAARDTPGDVGTSLTLAGEASRPDLAAVVAANFKRLQEALRSLEEYGKLVSRELGQACESLRYRSYAIERAASATQSSARRLAHVRLYVLVDGRRSAEEFAHLVACLIEAGVHALQLRDKQLDDRTLAARALELRNLTRGSGTLCIINDRPDIASLVRADGVHVGQEELTVGQARRLLPPGALVGLSTHSLEQARQGVLAGADYLGVGPVFPTPTKKFAHFLGVEPLRAVAEEIRLPWFAIGGITLDNIDQVLAAGARRVAVASAVCDAPDPAAAARRLLERLK